ncbi:carbonic anhydrase [Microbispora rosea]|uniref:carbonic anhydrase n=2 Tax=Microbispora rosea TaxID=58117 RepID=A0A1N6YKV3_9ACTN|nr:carbonic anhydrase [Microbispora rosea subsp. rosea]SIR15089.1 carbonic anhydrase [Microbispora rosea]
MTGWRASGNICDMSGAFDDLLDANEKYASTFTHSGLTGRAARGLAVVTCMDSRIDPLGLLGLTAGDAKILRNAGARVTDDVLRTLVLAVYLLGVDRVLVMPHTDCRMSKSTDEDVHNLIAADYGVDTRSLDFQTVPDQRAALWHDITRIKSSPYLPDDLVVGGALYDVHTGRLQPVEF